MTGRDAELRAPPRGEPHHAAALRWLGAGALALALHAGAALLLVREARPEPLDDGGGDAVAVELEPVEGEAVEPDRSRPAVPADEATAAAAAAPDAQASQATPPAADTPPQPDPPVRPPPDASPDPSPPETPPPSEAPPAPPTSPPPPATPPVAPSEVRPEPPAAPPVRAAPIAAASVASVASIAADEAAPAVQRLSAARAASWRGKLVPHLNRFRRALPGGVGGTARIGFTLDEGGRVTATSVAASSGDAALDEAARELVRRASPFPAPPPGLAGADLSFVVPVHYDGGRR